MRVYLDGQGVGHMQPFIHVVHASTISKIPAATLTDLFQDQQHQGSGKDNIKHPLHNRQHNTGYTVSEVLSVFWKAHVACSSKLATPFGGLLCV